jgi:hypothetical protein
MSTTIFISHAVLLRSLNSNISGDTIGQELLTIPERLHDTIPGVLSLIICRMSCLLPGLTCLGVNYQCNSVNTLYVINNADTMSHGVVTHGISVYSIDFHITCCSV